MIDVIAYVIGGFALVYGLFLFVIGAATIHDITVDSAGIFESVCNTWKLAALCMIVLALSGCAAPMTSAERQEAYQNDLEDWRLCKRRIRGTIHVGHQHPHDDRGVSHPDIKDDLWRNGCRRILRRD